MTEEKKKDDIILPTEVRKPLNDVPTSLGIVGKHKSGKTTALADLPENSLIIDTEHGAGFISGKIISMPKIS